MTVAGTSPIPLQTLGADLRRDSWTIAVEVVEEGLRDEALASLARLAPGAQLGDMATFIAELGNEIAHPDRDRVRASGPLADVARGHARAREALGFGPREVVTEFMVMRRVLQRYIAAHSADLTDGSLLEAEERLNDMVDRLTVECVGAYFDRAITELSDLARRDSLTGLLNYESFSEALARELERARRYERGLALVFIDVDGLGQVNDTYGPTEGDRVLRRIASVAHSMLRGSDIAGRVGDDEFGVLLLEADKHSAGRFLRRLREELNRLSESGELPPGCSCSAGAAHYGSEAKDAASLVRLADRRQVDAKRSR
jgi:diguanylate cyclase (GGDEF)-like protein